MAKEQGGSVSGWKITKRKETSRVSGIWAELTYQDSLLKTEQGDQTFPGRGERMRNLIKYHRWDLAGFLLKADFTSA